MEPERLYESSFTDRNPNGLAGLFRDDAANALLNVIEALRAA
jgi:hypothetical protein